MPTDKYLNKIVLNKMTREQFENLTVKNSDEFYAVTDNTILSSISMFDTVIKDHILTYEESKGWALQGTYVNSAVYPDFYAKCLEEYNEAIETETVNGVTVKVSANGHKFFDIADKVAIDGFFNTMGSAWFYGIDTEYERIFLPRDKYFAVTGVAPVVGNGMTLGLTDGTVNYGTMNAYHSSTQRGLAPSENYGASIGTTSTFVSLTNNPAFGVTTDSTKSGIEAHLTANEDKYLYICVGNTIVNEELIDVSKVLSEAVLRSSLVKVETVIETYVNGTSWYRIWSDGWCEQGGYPSVSNNGTITFLKPFKDINYTITLGNYAEGNYYCGFKNKTTTGVTVYSSYNPIYLHWQASGYIW